jgi:filamentous hemagglutinin family protein
MMRRAALALLWLLLWAQAVMAEPQGGTVTAGQAAIDQSVQGVTSITQFTERVIINWERYGVGLSELVRYLQPGELAVALNRVTGIDPSMILGSIQANGRVFVINPNGILFGPESRVDAGGFMASTLDISDRDFMDGKYVLMQDPDHQLSFVVNRGQIRASDGGFVILVAPLVSNEGAIIANLGHVVLGAGREAVLNFDGQGLFNFVLQDGSACGGGGNVVMTTEACADVLRQVVNHGNLADAGQVLEQDGQVVLMGGEGIASVSGSISSDGTEGRSAGSILVDSTRATILQPSSRITANGAGSASGGGEVRILSDMQNGVSALGPGARIEARGGQSGNGGLVEVSARNFQAEGALVDTSATCGCSGTFLLDPYNVEIWAGVNQNGSFAGGIWIPSGTPSTISASGLAGQLLTNNVVVTTGTGGAESGDITVNSAINSATANGITLTAAGNVNINAPISIGGNFTSTGVNFTSSASGSISSGERTVTLRHSGSVAVGAPIAAGDITLNADSDHNGTGDLTISPGASIGTGSTTGTISLEGHTVSIGAPVRSSGPVFIQPSTDSRTVGIGTGAGGFQLDATEIGFLQDGFSAITIGRQTGTAVTDVGNIAFNDNITIFSAGVGGSMNISGPLTTAASNSDINLVSGSGGVALGAGIDAGTRTIGISGGFINQTAGSVTASSLALRGASGPVTMLSAANNVSVLAGSVDDAASSFQYTDADSLTVGSVRFPGTLVTIDGIMTGGGDIILRTADLILGNYVNSGSGTASFFATTITQTSGRVIGAGLAMNASAGGIGASGQPVLISADTVAAAAPSDIFLSELNDVTVGNLSGISGITTTAADGSIFLEAPGTLATTHDITADGAGTIGLYATGVLGDMTTDSTISSASGVIILSADRNVTLGGSTAVATSGEIRILADAVGSGAGTLIVGTGTTVGTVLTAGPVMLQGAAVSIGGQVAGSGSLLLQPSLDSIGIGIGDLATGGFNLDVAEIALLQNGFSSITIGRPAGTGAVDIRSVTFNDPITIQAGGAGGSITITGAFRTAENSAAVFTAGSGNLGTFTQTINFNYLIDTGGGDLSITADSIALNTFANTIAGTGQILLQPSTSSRPLVIGAAGTAGDFALTTAELGAIANNHNSIIIGQSAGSGPAAISAVTFTDPVTVRAGAIAVNGQITGSGNASVTLDCGVAAGSSTTLNADIITAGNAITLAGKVILGTPGAILLNTTSGSMPAGASIHCTSSVEEDGTASDWTLNAGTGGDVSLDGPVGSGTRIGSFTITGARNVTTGAIRCSRITQSAGAGTATFNGALDTDNVLGTTLTGNAFIINGTVTTANSGPMTVSNGGLLTVGPGCIMTLDGSFTQSGAGSVVTAGNITTTGDDLSFASAVMLSGNVALNTGPGSGNILFGSTLTGSTPGGQSLGITAGTGNVTFTGAVGGTRLGILSIYSASNVTADTVSATSIAFGTPGNPVTGLSAFNGALDASDPAGITLIGNNFSFNGPVTTTGGGAVTITNGGLLTMAAAGDMNLSGAFIQNGAGPVSTAADITTAGMVISFATPVTLTGNVLLNSGGGNIGFAGTLDATTAGTQSLGLTAGAGNIVFTGAVGGTRLGALTINSASNVTFDAVNVNSLTQSAGSGTTTFNGALSTFAASGVSLTGNTFTFNDTVTTTNYGTMMVNNSGLLTLASAADLTLDGTFIQGGGGAVSLGADITTTNKNIVIAGAATLTGPVVLNAGWGSVSLGSVAAGANSLAITADGIAFQGGANSVSGSGGIILQPSSASISIGIAGAPGTLQLSAATLAALRAGFSQVAIGRADGSHAIRINAVTFRDPVLIQAPLGTGSIQVDGQITGNSTVTLDGPGATTALNAGIVTLGSRLMISDGVLVGAAAGVLLDTTNGGTIPGGADIEILGTINSSPGNVNSLTLRAGTTGDVILAGAVGSVTPLFNLAIISARNMNLPALTLNGALTQSLGTGSTILSGVASVGSVDISSPAIAVNAALNSAGATSFTGAFSAASPVISGGNFLLTGDANLSENLTTLNANLRITGNLVVAEGLNLQISSGFGIGDLNIGGTINGAAGGNPENLSLLAGLGNVTVGGTIGGAAPLGNLTIHSAFDVTLPRVTLTGILAQTTGSGTTMLGGLVTADSMAISTVNLVLASSVEVNGGIAVTAATTLASDVEIISLMGGNFSFIGPGTINGAHFLNLNTGTTGLITIGGAVGNTAQLTELRITSSGGLLAGGPVSAGLLNILGGTGTVAFNGALNVMTMAAAPGGYNIEFNGGGTVTNASSLLNTGNVIFGNGITFTGGVTHNSGSSTIQGSMTGPLTLGATTLSGRLTLDGGLGNLQFGSLVLSDGTSAALTTSGGNITVSGTTDGTLGGNAENLELSSGSGNILLGGGAGSTAPLANIVIAGAGDVSLPRLVLSGALTQSAGTGNTTLNGPVSAGSLSLTGNNLLVLGAVSSAGSVSFSGSLQTSAAISSGGAFTVNGSAVLGNSVTAGGGNLVVTGGLVIAEGGAVQLSNGGGSGNITLGGTVDGTSGGNLESLDMVGGSGNISLSGAVGSSVPLGNLTIAGASNVNMQTVNVSGSLAQAAGSGTTTLGGNVNAGSISMTAGAFAVNGTVYSSGSTSFNGTLRTTAGINSSGDFTQTGNSILGGDVTGSSDISFLGNLTLSGAGPFLISASSGSGDILVSGTIDGAAGRNSALALAAGTGGITVEGAVGAGTPLGNFNISGASGVNLPRMTLNGGLVQNGGVGRTTFHGRVDAAGGVSVSAGSIVFDGIYGSINAGAGSVVLSAATGSIQGGFSGADVSAVSAVLNAASDIGSPTNSLDTMVGTLEARAAGGSIYLIEADPLVLDGISAAVGINIANTYGDMTVNSVTAPSSGTVTLASGGSMLRGGTGASNITAGTASLSSSTGIGSSTEALRTTVGVLSASAVNGSVYIRETDGVLVNALSCGLAGTMSLEAGGSILDGNASVVNVSGGSGSLSAVGNIGSSSDALETSVGSLSATALGGSIFIDESDDITLRSVTGGVDVYVTTHSDGTITVNSVSAGNLLSLVVLGGVRAPGAGSILADGTVGVNVSAPSGHLVARGDIGTSSSALRTSLGTLDASAPNGSVYISEADTLLVNTLSAGTNASVTCATGNMVLNTLTAGGRASLTAPGGTVSGGTGSTANVTSSSVVLGSRGDTGSSGNYLRISSGALDATCTEGSLYVRNLSSGSMSLGDVSAGQDIRLEGTGDFSLGSVRAVRDAYLTLSSGSVFSGTPGRTNLSSGRDARIVVGGVIGLSGTPFGVNIPGVLSVSASGSIGGYSVVINGPNNLVLLNQPPGKVANNTSEGGGENQKELLSILQAVSNADNPFIANVPGFHSILLLMVVSPGDTEPEPDPLLDEEALTGDYLYVTPALKREAAEEKEPVVPPPFLMREEGDE